MRTSSPWNSLLSTLLLTLLPVAALAQGDVDETDAFTRVDQKTLLAEKELERSLWTQLQNRRVIDASYGEIRAELGAAEKALLAGTAEKSFAVPNNMIGMHVDVRQRVVLSNRQRGDVGAVEKDAGGGFIWTSSIEVPEASALRIHFTDFALPKGAEFYVYNDEGQVHGPYTDRGPNGNGRFWSHTVFGEHAWLQVHAAAVPRGGAFLIESVSHLGPDFELPKVVGRGDKADCSQNVSCIENAECYDLDSILSSARRAVARMVYEKDGISLTCSGSLLNDQDNSTTTPWFLTADHCIDNEDSADSLETFFQYQSPCGSCSGSYVDSVLGSDLWAHGEDGDFSLVELSELPSSWTLQGWTNAKVDTIGTQLYRISHPNSAPQSFSQHEVIKESGSYVVTDPVIGTIQGGSSGSPIFRSDRKVVGQLSGVTHPQDTYDLCDGGVSFNTRDGALSYYWLSVKAYLTGGLKTAKMHVTDVVAGVHTSSFAGLNLYFPELTVTVADQLGNAAVRARVFVNVDGVSLLGLTDDSGVVTIRSPALHPSSPSFTGCVTDITHDYFTTYDSASNTVTCDDH